MARWWLTAVVLFLGSLAAARPDPTPTTNLRFKVTVAAPLAQAKRSGRVLVVLGRRGQAEPRFTIGDAEPSAAPLLGRDLDITGPDAAVVLDATAQIFPLARLADLPAGEYSVQAVFHDNRDLNLPNAPGNLYSPAKTVALDPAKGGTVELELSKQVPPEQLPRDTEFVRYHKFPSPLLTKFHGRPMFYRAAVLLPKGFAKDPHKQYPLRVHVGGYGTRFTAITAFQASATWAADTRPMVTLLLDGAGPYGDPYQVDSANNGPYGQALTEELIPFVEKEYRCIGQPYARVLDGASTGGWVSLALQVFYPDYFNGCWSSCPDPVDFRAYELIDIYRDANAYVNRTGFERPAKRNVQGETLYTVRHECQVERVLGRGDRWWTSGKDWCAWNAVFGPRGADGLPVPLWDGATGQIDKAVLDHWRKYDLRLHLETNWATLAPKLRGKIRVWVGEADDYFLNNAVHHLDRFLSRAQPAYGGSITFAPGRPHTGGWTDAAATEEMMRAIDAARPAP